jgi:hypothetical protein
MVKKENGTGYILKPNFAASDRSFGKLRAAELDR